MRSCVPWKRTRVTAVKTEGQEAGDDLEIALKERIGLQRDAPQPEGSSDHKKEAARVREEDCRATAAILKR
jgi:hypothetical protein